MTEMDFSLGSLVSLGNGVSASERSLAPMASEMDDSAQQQQRMLANSAMSPTSAEEMFIPNSQRRSASELDLSDHRRDELVIPIKLARNDSFSSRSHHDVKMMQSASAASFHALRPSSALHESRMLGSPAAYRTISEDRLVNNKSTSYSEADSRLQGVAPQLMQCYAAAYVTGQSPTPLRCVPSFQHDPYAQHQRPTPANLPLAMAREGLVHSGMHEATIISRQVFTAAQWAELEHQALIYKYLMHGAPVPAELLLPIRRSLANMGGLHLSSQNLTNVGWTSFQLGAAGNLDPEPGRCRRTDGKKWRCARPVVPEQKYCERHVHRGRHRKKAAEAQNSSANASLPSPKQALSPSAGRDNSQTSPLASEIHHTPKPSPSPLSSHTSHMPNRPPSAQNITASGGIAMGTTSAGSLTCNRFSLPLHSASSLSLMKCNRSMNGLSKANFGLRPEQQLSDFSVSTRELGDHPHFPPSVPSIQQRCCQMQLQKLPPAITLKPSCVFLPQQNSNHNLEYFQEQDELAYIADATRLNMLLGHHEHQQHYRPSYFPGEALNDDSTKISEGHALRHFFDDWPRSRDSSTLSWSDEEEKQKTNGSSTQLSISIPNNSSDISAPNSPNYVKTVFSPLRLSMPRCAEDIPDPTHMGLGVGMGLGINNSSQRQACWFPRSLEQGVGGPLAEVLHSGSHSGKKTSLNLLRDEWDTNQPETPHMASPTGVLQKVTLGTCFSDSSSNASSPGSVRNEHPVADNHRLNPVLTNCSSRLST